MGYSHQQLDGLKLSGISNPYGGLDPNIVKQFPDLGLGIGAVTTAASVINPAGILAYYGISLGLTAVSAILNQTERRLQYLDSGLTFDAERTSRRIFGNAHRVNGWVLGAFERTRLYRASGARQRPRINDQLLPTFSRFTDLRTQNYQLLDIVMWLAEGELTSLDRIYIGDEEYPLFQQNNVQISTGEGTGTMPSPLTTKHYLPPATLGALRDRFYVSSIFAQDATSQELQNRYPDQWNELNKASGHSWVIVTLIDADDALFQNVPEITFGVKGQKVTNMADPTKEIYTDNVAAIEHWIWSNWVEGFDSSKVDLRSFQDAYSWARRTRENDYNVYQRLATNRPLPVQSTQLFGRYPATSKIGAFHGVIESETPMRELIRRFNTIRRGNTLPDFGKVKITVGENLDYSGAVRITDNDLADRVTINAKPNPRVTFNTVRATIPHSQPDSYERVEIEVTDTELLERDNGRVRVRNIGELHGVTDKMQAQGICVQEARTMRHAVSYEIPLKPHEDFLRLRHNDPVIVDLKTYRLDNIPVRTIRPEIDPATGIVTYTGRYSPPTEFAHISYLPSLVTRHLPIGIAHPPSSITINSVIKVTASRDIAVTTVTYETDRYYPQTELLYQEAGSNVWESVIFVNDRNVTHTQQIRVLEEDTDYKIKLRNIAREGSFSEYSAEIAHNPSHDTTAPPVPVGIKVAGLPTGIWVSRTPVNLTLVPDFSHTIVEMTYTPVGGTQKTVTEQMGIGGSAPFFFDDIEENQQVQISVVLKDVDRSGNTGIGSDAVTATTTEGLRGYPAEPAFNYRIYLIKPFFNYVTVNPTHRNGPYVDTRHPLSATSADIPGAWFLRTRGKVDMPVLDWATLYPTIEHTSTTKGQKWIFKFATTTPGRPTTTEDAPSGWTAGVPEESDFPSDWNTNAAMGLYLCGCEVGTDGINGAWQTPYKFGSKWFIPPSQKVLENAEITNFFTFHHDLNNTPVFNHIKTLVRGSYLTLWKNPETYFVNDVEAVGGFRANASRLEIDFSPNKDLTRIDTELSLADIASSGWQLRVISEALRVPPLPVTLGYSDIIGPTETTQSITGAGRLRFFTKASNGTITYLSATWANILGCDGFDLSYKTHIVADTSASPAVVGTTEVDESEYLKTLVHGAVGQFFKSDTQNVSWQIIRVTQNTGWVRVELNTSDEFIVESRAPTINNLSNQDYFLKFEQQRPGAKGDKGDKGDKGLSGEDGFGEESIFKLSATDTAPANPARTRKYDWSNPTDGFTDDPQPTTTALPYLWKYTRKVPGSPAVDATPTSTWGDWVRDPEPYHTHGTDSEFGETVWRATSGLVPRPTITQPTDRTKDNDIPAGFTDNKTDAVIQESLISTPFLWASYRFKTGGTPFARTWTDWTPPVLLSVRNVPTQAFFIWVPRYKIVQWYKWKSYSRTGATQTITEYTQADVPSGKTLDDIRWIDGPTPPLPGQQFGNTPPITIPQKLITGSVSATTPSDTIEHASDLFKYRCRYRNKVTDAWIGNTLVGPYPGVPTSVNFGQPTEVNRTVARGVHFEDYCFFRHFNENTGQYDGFSTPAPCGIVDDDAYVPVGGTLGDVLYNNGTDPIWRKLTRNDIEGLTTLLNTYNTRITRLENAGTGDDDDDDDDPEYGTSISATHNSLTVTCSGGPSSGDWRLRHTSLGGNTWTTLPAQSSNVFTISSLSPSTSYDIQISRGGGSWSERFYGTTSLDPSTQWSVTADPNFVNDTQVSVGLDITGSSRPSSIDYYYSTSGATPASSQARSGQITIQTGLSPAIGLTGLTANTQYYLFVKNALGNWQSVYNFRTLHTISKVTSVSFRNTLANGVTIAWGSVSNVTEYYIYIRESTTLPANALERYSPTGTTQVATGLFAERTYYVWIRGIYDGLDGIRRVTGPLSDRHSFTTSDLPAMGSVSFNNTGVSNNVYSWTASWNAVTGATGYDIQWANNNTFTGVQASAIREVTSLSHRFPTLGGSGHYFRIRPKSGTVTGDFRVFSISDPR